MTAPSREAQEILDKLVAIAEQIQGYEATLWQLKFEHMRLQSKLRATGWRPLATDPQESLL